MVQPWFSHGSAMVQPWFSHGSAMVQPWFSHGSAMPCICAPTQPRAWIRRALCTLDLLPRGGADLRSSARSARLIQLALVSLVRQLIYSVHEIVRLRQPESSKPDRFRIFSCIWVMRARMTSMRLRNPERLRIRPRERLSYCKL